MRSSLARIATTIVVGSLVVAQWTPMDRGPGDEIAGWVDTLDLPPPEV
jgi:hypothetical protein